MEYRFTFDAWGIAGLLVLTLSGHARREDFEAYLAELAHEPRMRDVRHVIADMRAVDVGDLTTLDLRDLATARPDNAKPMRVALVAERALGRVLAQRFVALGEGQGIERRVFATMEDARRWLQLPLRGDGETV